MEEKCIEPEQCPQASIADHAWCKYYDLCDQVADVKFQHPCKRANRNCLNNICISNEKNEVCVESDTTFISSIDHSLQLTTADCVIYGGAEVTYQIAEIYPSPTDNDVNAVGETETICRKETLS
jgi:hypothetical protein